MAGVGADSFYVQDCRSVQNSTHTIQTLTGQISRLAMTLQGEKDVKRCSDMVDEAVRLAVETKDTLGRVREHQQQAQNAGEKNNRRMMCQKLGDNLAITARVLEDVIRRFQGEEERRRQQKSKEMVIMGASGAADADAAGGDEQSQQQLLLGGAGAGLEMQAKTDENCGRAGSFSDGPGGAKTSAAAQHLEAELQEERCQQLTRIDEEMRSLQRIYTDLATSAEEQQAAMDTLESHMLDARMDLESGRREIQTFDKYTWGRVKRRAVAVAVGTTVAVLVYNFVGG